MIRQNLLLHTAILVLVLLGCKSKKEVPQVIAEPPKPAWISQRPAQNSTYIGIGMAQKSAGPDYAQRAKNNALNDLASEISVEISSTSLLYQVESNNQFKEDFQSNTKTKNTATLSGYEQVDVYESSTEYWVIYQLDKRVYQQQKEERLNRAIALCKDHLASYLPLKKQNQIAQSLPHLFKAIEAVQDFWAEPLNTQLNNQEVYLGNFLFKELLEAYNELQLLPLSSLAAKRGTIPSPLTCFVVQSKQNHTQANIPIKLRYSGGRLKQSHLQSNQQGEVVVSFQKVTSTNNSESIQGTVDLDALIDLAGGSAMLHQLIQGLPEITSTASVQIIQPTAWVSSSVHVNGIASANTSLQSTLKDLLQQERIQLIGSAKKADFTVSLKLTTTTSPSGNFFTAVTTGELTAHSSTGTLLVHMQLVEVKGVQNTEERAIAEAYRKMQEELKRRHFRDLRRQLFDQ